jgi:hypothetical protein
MIALVSQGCLCLKFNTRLTYLLTYAVNMVNFPARYANGAERLGTQPLPLIFCSCLVYLKCTVRMRGDIKTHRRLMAGKSMSD